MNRASRRHGQQVWSDTALFLGGVISAAVALSFPRWLIGLLIVLTLTALALWARWLCCAERRSHR